MKLPSSLLFFYSLLTNSAYTHSFCLKKLIIFSILRMSSVFFFIYNPVYADWYLIFNRIGSSTEKHLLFTKCYSYFILIKAFAFWENKTFGKFRFFFELLIYTNRKIVLYFDVTDDG